MDTILFFRKKSNGTSLLTVLNSEEHLENPEEHIREVIQSFEESWDRPITSLEEIPAEYLEECGLSIVQNVVAVNVDDDTLFRHYDANGEDVFMDYMDKLEKRSGI